METIFSFVLYRNYIQILSFGKIKQNEGKNAPKYSQNTPNKFDKIPFDYDDDRHYSKKQSFGLRYLKMDI